MADNDLIPPQIVTGGGGSAPPPQRAPDYRQIQQPEELPVLAIDRAASGMGEAGARRAAELGNAFKEFEGVSTSFGDRLAALAGKQAGAAAGATGQGAPRTGLQAVTAYGQGYNSAVHQTYITQSQLQLEQQLTDIEGKTQGDPNSFQTQATAAVEGAFKGMDPLYHPEMALWAQSRIQAGVNRQKQQAATDAQNQALATYQSSTPDLITAGLHTAAALPGPQGDAVIAKLVSDDQDRLNALVASRTITPEQAVRLHQKMVDDTHQQMTGQKIDISLQPILATMRSNVEAADRLIMRDDPNLSADENAIRLQEFEKDRQAYVQSQTRANVGPLTDVHARLANGDYGQDVERTLHSLYQRGALSEEGLFSAMAESLRNQRAGIERDGSLQMVDDIVHGERQGPLDPKNKEQADAVDQYFQEHIAQSGAVSDAQYATGAVEIFKQTGILPASVQSRIRIGIMSGDPIRAAAAAALSAKIQSVNPEADAFVSNPKLAALSSLINDNLKAGMSPQQAYSLAVGRTDVSSEVRKIRDGNYNKALKAQGTNAAALQSSLDAATPGLFAHAPPAPTGMQADYETLVHEFYDQTGDLGKARELAGAQLRTTWGVSTVNGSPELTKYPIPQSQVPAVRADIAAAAKAAGYTGDPSDLHLAPIAATDETHGKVWGVVHAGGDVVLNQHNRPLQYTVPAAPDFTKARQAIIDQRLSQARALRDAQRENSADQVKFEAELANQYLRGNPAQRLQAGR